MDNTLQIMVIAFMAFLCLLCLFAVFVIVRDIVSESLRARRERQREDREYQRWLAEQNQQQAPVQQVVIKEVVVEKQPEPVAEPVEQEVVATEAPVEEVAEPVEQPVVEEVVEEQPVEEVAEVEEEKDDNSVSFTTVQLSMEEKYAMLSPEMKLFFDDIAKYALGKPDVKELKLKSSYDYKNGSYRVLRMSLKRGEIVCEFTFINRDFANYASTSNVKFKQASTTVRVSEAAAVGVVKDGIDRVCQQIAEDKLYKKELSKEKRRARRRFNKENALAEQVVEQAEQSEMVVENADE